MAGRAAGERPTRPWATSPPTPLPMARRPRACSCGARGWRCVPTIDRAREIYGRMGATWQEQKSRFVWPSGAVLYLRYLDRDQDADAYQGHDYTRVYVEELTQFASPRPIDKLKATLRSAAGVPCGFRATCNPGGPGHAWVKARYIDAGRLSSVVGGERPVARLHSRPASATIRG